MAVPRTDERYWPVLAEMLDAACSAARAPGGILAVVDRSGLLFATGTGQRRLGSSDPMTPGTPFPIASTIKPMNAALIAVLAVEGVLDWDRPIRTYIPGLALSGNGGDPVTLRDLVSMRTGLPRHDFVWSDPDLTRASLVERLPHLERTAIFRDRFQYSNISAAVAGHAAELATGKRWEELLYERLLEPLGMVATHYLEPPAGLAIGYRENVCGELVEVAPRPSPAAAPAGSAFYSTVGDMARWVRLLLGGNASKGIPRPSAIVETFGAELFAGGHPAAPSARAAYGRGWFVDNYSGEARISHSGLMDGINSELAVFPGLGIGIIAVVNFAPPRIARWIVESALDTLAGGTPAPLSSLLERYEQALTAAMRSHPVAPKRTARSSRMTSIFGRFEHPGYGAFEIVADSDGLTFQRGMLNVPLLLAGENRLAFAHNDMGEIHKPHPFHHSARLEIESEGNCALALHWQLEIGLPPARFARTAS